MNYELEDLKEFKIHLLNRLETCDPNDFNDINYLIGITEALMLDNNSKTTPAWRWFYNDYFKLSSVN